MDAKYAFVFGARRREEVAAYMPAGYCVIGEGQRDGRTFYVIGGYDHFGWTLHEYVTPRLASGLMFAEEVTSDQARAVCCGWLLADPADLIHKGAE